MTHPNPVAPTNVGATVSAEGGVTETIWVNLYPDGRALGHATEEKARACADENDRPEIAVKFVRAIAAQPASAQAELPDLSELDAQAGSAEPAALSDREIAQKVIDLVGPLCDRGTFEAPDWAIYAVHAAMYWDQPERQGRLAGNTAPAPVAAGWREVTREEAFSIADRILGHDPMSWEVDEVVGQLDQIGAVIRTAQRALPE